VNYIIPFLYGLTPEIGYAVDDLAELRRQELPVLERQDREP
jgi:hypothetical protein